MDKSDATTASPWSWHPELPLENSPLYAWPPRPLDAARHVLGPGFLLSPAPIYVGLALAIWFYLMPDPARWVVFEPGWVLQVFCINLGMVVLFAGSLHLFFYTFRGQGEERRFDPRALERDNPKFFLGNQVWDNIFWTCASGVTICTGYLVLGMWAYANGLMPWLQWSEHPLWFALLFLVIPYWSTFHFYLIHRLLHWRPLYKLAHEVHHRNTRVGPWSGLSMHPIEHLLYFSSVVIHVVVATHPVHLYYQLNNKLLNAIAEHSGVGDLLVKGKPVIGVGDFYHQLHHRYFDCNYGGPNIPCDLWAGSFHDGTPAATARVRELQRARQAGRQRAATG